MSKRSLGSVIKEMLNEEKFPDDESYIKQCRRNFARLIEKLGGSIDDMKNSKNVIEFEEAEVPVIKVLLKSVFMSSDNPVGKFLFSKDNDDFSAEDAAKFIEYIVTESYVAANDATKEKMVKFLSDDTMVSHVRIIEDCHKLVDSYARELQHLVKSEQLIHLQLLKDEIFHFHILELVERAYRMAVISNEVELYKDGEEKVGCIYEGLPKSVQSEYVQRDIEILKAIQEDDDLRAYIEKKTGKKAEDIFNYRALRDFSIYFKEIDIDN